MSSCARVGEPALGTHDRVTTCEPAPQAEQAVVGSPLDSPAGHGVHESAPAEKLEKLPAGQKWQTDWSCESVLYRPAKQSRHALPAKMYVQSAFPAQVAWVVRAAQVLR
jgi:hypothetical protein